MRKRILLLALISGLFLSLPAMATNGYWSYGYGPKSKSIAGACVAMSFGAMCAASNPASLVRVGNRIEAGASLFAPTRGFTANDDAQTPPYASIPPGEYKSANDLFLLPHFASNYMLDEQSSIGVAIGANGGMNTEYDSAVFARFSPPGVLEYQASAPVGVDLKQMFVGISYSRLLSEEHSIGITPILAVQSISVTGLEPFRMFSKYPDSVTNNGTDVSVGGGVRFGWLWRVNQQLKLGASYQTRLWMQKFDSYKGLFAEAGDFDIPPNFDLGFSYRFTPEWTFAFDYQRIQYSEVNAVGNPADLVFIPGSTLLGTDDGLGFGWNDQNVYKFGVQWQYSDDLTLRAGYSYATDTFENSQALFNILAPAVIKEHFTGGFGLKLGGGHELNAAFMYAPEEQVTGTNPNTGPQTGDLWMDQWEVEIGWAMRF
ncbi:OmpP1/FadL family transporter [Candidatus Endoriftia persephone]|jgi:long-chain fatty acid transport protein|uniref:Outer membrane protein transport protein n=3 Tax=Gammaproteobacteria TaxID=1236 RepID=G2FDV4_9GAMM|nr:outer membrane protein transport protein [Candidatus Endoriftia persephone]EGW54938.1 outer membrane protein transport protein [endosymbiont of Tevnia jerichonana (vent Tica)]USF87906.1 outer membrane protein transport protein [Candidatus Endoriftia persephone]